MARELTFAEKAERSVMTTYRKKIWNPFTLAVKKYRLVEEGDKIAVCISGGKDSMLLAKLMEMLQKYGDVPFELVYLSMDPGYNAENAQKIAHNAALLEIPLVVFRSDIFEIANGVTESPCYLCARMRRGHLYAKAKELGCNKIALGHHFDDVVETTLLGMFYGAQIQAMRPKLKSKNFAGMELIRPLFCVQEDDVIAWKNHNGLDFIQCACRFTENAAGSGDGIGKSKRLEIKAMLKEMKKTNPDAARNVFTAIHAVCLDTMLGWKTKDGTFSFLDDY